jgi:hypothetical protein
MLKTPLNIVTGLLRTVTGGGDGPDPERSQAASRAAATRRREARKRSDAARKAAQTRQTKAKARSTAAKKGATTRGRRRARVDAMVEATKD